MKILVTGGAGYIGSIASQSLIDAGFDVTIYDNLSTGFRELIPTNAKFIFGDTRDRELLPRVLRDQKIEAVMHFAAKLIVPESVREPIEYYDVNTLGTLNLVRACHKEGIKKLVFSSTAAVYGDAPSGLVRETDELAPVNPYGSSKRAAEEIIRTSAGDLRFMILRYFNVAGASDDLKRGIRSSQATHLVKVAAEVACGKRPEVKIFGTDYQTADGTCVRDYIHVADLAEAHVLVLKALNEGHRGGVFNCGYGRGFSVREVLKTMQKVSGNAFAIVENPRRDGDPSQVVASTDLLREEFNWKPHRDSLEKICLSAFEWEKSL